MLDVITGWYHLLLDVLAASPPLRAAVLSYPVGCAVSIYYVQGLKRAQLRETRAALVAAQSAAKAANLQAVFAPPRRLTAFELRGISILLSGGIVFVIVRVFLHETAADQLLAHMLLGGLSAPMLMAGVITLCEWKFPELALRLKTGDKRHLNGESPTGVERRDGDDTGEFYTNG